MTVTKRLLLLTYNVKYILIGILVFAVFGILNPVYWWPNVAAPIAGLVLVATLYSFCFGPNAVVNDNRVLEHEILTSLSVRTTFKRIFRDSSKLPGHIGCLTGIRTLCTIWIITLHAWFVPLTSIPDDDARKNYTNAFKYNFFVQPVLTGAHAVDVFFLMSGMLMTFNWLHRANQGTTNIGSLSDWLCFFRTRILRLWPMYLITFGFAYTITNQMVPLEQSPNCSSQFWLQFFMLGTVANQHKCAMWMWYIQDEFIFVLFAPIFLLTLYKSRTLGWTLGVVQITASHVFLVFSESFGIDAYYHPLFRIMSFVCGVLLGDLVHRKRMILRNSPYSQEQTTRKQIMLRILGWFIKWRYFVKKLTYSKYFCGSSSACSVGWTLCGFAFFYTTWGPWIRTFLEDGNMAATIWDIVYGITHYLIFSILSAWIIYQCIFGYARPLNWILSVKPWSPLSHITYGAYMVHMLIQYIVFSIMGMYYWYGHAIQAAFTFGTIFLGFFIGAIFTVIFEFPASQFESLMVKKWTAWRETMNANDRTIDSGGLVMSNGDEQHGDDEEPECGNDNVVLTVDNTLDVANGECTTGNETHNPVV